MGVIDALATFGEKLRGVFSSEDESHRIIKQIYAVVSKAETTLNYYDDSLKHCPKESLRKRMEAGRAQNIVVTFSDLKKKINKILTEF